jgi:hypothetical protein
MSAVITNSITNALHALFLFFYFCCTCIYWLKGDKRFIGLIVLFFLIIFGLKILGVWAHYAEGKAYTPKIWLAIALGIVFLNYCTVYMIKTPLTMRVIIIFISLLGVWFNTYSNDNNFLYLAVPLLLTYLTVAIYSKNTTRLGFILIFLSNIIWILLREGSNIVLGHEVPVAYRYDNDIYHVLLIISTFILFRSIFKGDWSYPESISK